jgi:hypothetical protein
LEQEKRAGKFGLNDITFELNIGFGDIMVFLQNLKRFADGSCRFGAPLKFKYLGAYFIKTGTIVYY